MLVLSAGTVNLAAPHQELCSGVLTSIKPAVLEVCGFIRSPVTVLLSLRGLHSKPREVSRYLSVAFNAFGSDLSCSLVLMSLP